MLFLQRLAITRPVGAAMVLLGLSLMGLIALLRIETNLLPEMRFPRVTIVTRYANASPEEIETLITRPLSEAISSAGGLEKITSESIEGASIITAQFRWGRNVDFAVMELRERADQIRNAFPQQADRPIVSRFDPSARPFFEIAVFARRDSDERDLRYTIENELRPYFERADGVAMVELSGGYRKEIQADVDIDRLAQYGLSFEELAASIRGSNVNVPAGHITAGNQDVLIRTIGEYASVEEIADTVIPLGDGAPATRLGHIAAIRSGYAERRGFARYNQRECVLISLRKESGANSIRASEEVRAQLARVNQEYGARIELHPVYDEARFVEEAVGNITSSLIAGGLLAFVALILILRNFSSPLILVSVIPVALLTSILLMYMQGLSLNIMSLGGLALGIGMLFDSGNVILSAIERQHMLGLPPREAALKGVSEVTGSVVTAVLTTVIVFLPVVFLESLAGIVFREMALTVTYSLLASLFASLTMIPMLAALRKPGKGRQFLARRAIIQKAAAAEDALQHAYEKSLQSVMYNPRRLLIITALLFAAAMALFPFVHKEFLPRVDSGEVSIEVNAPAGSSLDQSAELARRLEETALAISEVQHVISRVGYEQDNLLAARSGDAGTHRAELRIILAADASQSSDSLAERLRETAGLREDIRVEYRLSGDVLTEILTPDTRPVTIEVAGEELEALERIGGEVKTIVAAAEDVVDVRSSLDFRPPEYRVYFLPDRMAEAGVSVATASDYLRTAIDGSVVSRFRVGDDEIDIRLRGAGAPLASLDSLDRLSLKASGGVRIRVLDLTRVRLEPGLSAVYRTGDSRVNRITAGVAEDANLGAVFSDLDQRLAALALPEGYRIAYGGERENIEESYRDMGLAFGLSVALIFMLLAARFESITHALVMLATIPLILIGVTPALILTGNGLNVSSFTGVILLVGIVVDNAGLLYEYMEILQHEGYSFSDSIEQASKIILRPLVLNNGTTVLGLLPVALELGRGSEFQAPMAVAVISGLLTSMLLSLYVVPALFHMIGERRTQS